MSACSDRLRALTSQKNPCDLELNPRCIKDWLLRLPCLPYTPIETALGLKTHKVDHDN